MGDDFFSLQVYTGQSPSAEIRKKLIRVVKESLTASNFVEIPGKEQLHNRIIAIGPEENTPWLAVYDSITYPDDSSQFELLVSVSEFVKLAKAISVDVGPSVIIHMDDSCSVGFELFVAGQLVDKYQDNPTIGWLVRRGKWSETERKVHAGQPEVWIKNLGLKDDDAAVLRQAWPTDGQGVSSPTILKNTAKILGWNEHLCRTGYNIGADGIPHPYQVIASNYAGYGDNDFEELYFFRPQSSS